MSIILGSAQADITKDFTVDVGNVAPTVIVELPDPPLLEGDEVTVAFKGNAGVKRLLMSFAGLEKVDSHRDGTGAPASGTNAAASRGGHGEEP